MKINREKWIKLIASEPELSIDCGSRPDIDEFMKGVEMKQEDINYLYIESININEKLRIEIEMLRQRLEISEDHNYDGIESRDETIRLLEADAVNHKHDLEQYIAEISKLKEIESESQLHRHQLNHDIVKLTSKYEALELLVIDLNKKRAELSE